ncbi:MAG: hypothetical protein A2133_07895 [Actinobacteria bacterium RBG_16_64_13]|nr:MAG: hypothetical protein A2133_07895 [Actinobacteria bacterium RBG_16_64_13]
MEQHFLAQMIPHHEGAVAMAQLALTRAQHPELKRLAQTIIQDQTREIEQMRSWYRAWYGGEVPVGDAGSWDSGTGGGMMGGGMMGGGMMGGGMMSGYTDLRALEAATSFDKEFIEQMVPHHQMAVMMAHMALARADRSEVQQLARSIVTTQTQEIRQMREWYRAWYQ